MSEFAIDLFAIRQSPEPDSAVATARDQLIFIRREDGETHQIRML
jgi:hypothetical protein